MVDINLLFAMRDHIWALGYTDTSGLSDGVLAELAGILVERFDVTVDEAHGVLGALASGAA